MPTIVLRFPGGRYHATPGGHHVNEGLVEWPPSPWRLVRALVACGFTTQHWREIPPAGRRLVESLSSVLPEYRLPRGALAHSRHYMPTTKFKDGREEPTLVIDTFADVGDGALWVRWPTALDDEARDLFGVLASHLGYLGRSESWVSAEAIDDDVALPREGLSFPHVDGAHVGRGMEQIALLSPDDPLRYAAWRLHEVAAAESELGLTHGKKPTSAQMKQRAKIQSLYPNDLVDCLQRDSSWWRGQGWSRAPGSRTVIYWRESNALSVGAASSPRPVEVPRVEMMLLCMTTPSGSRSALPSVVRTVPQAEILHRALVSRLGFDGEPCPELVGRDARGTPLRGHQHAHLLPIDLDADGRLDHSIVFAPMGLGASAQDAVRRLRRTFTKGGVGELQVAIAGAGSLEDLRSLGDGLALAIEGFLGAAGGSSSWMSATPFVPPRHVKRRGRASLTGQIEEELSSRGFPRADVEILEPTAQSLALRHFVRSRSRGPQPPMDAGFAVRLRFEEPVRGPICIGYGSHFGLGRFSAEIEPFQESRGRASERRVERVDDARAT